MICYPWRCFRVRLPPQCRRPGLKLFPGCWLHDIGSRGKSGMLDNIRECFMFELPNWLDSWATRFPDVQLLRRSTLLSRFWTCVYVSDCSDTKMVETAQLAHCAPFSNLLEPATSIPTSFGRDTPLKRILYKLDFYGSLESSEHLAQSRTA